MPAAKRHSDATLIRPPAALCKSSAFWKTTQQRHFAYLGTCEWPVALCFVCFYVYDVCDVGWCVRELYYCNTAASSYSGNKVWLCLLCQKRTKSNLETASAVHCTTYYYLQLWCKILEHLLFEAFTVHVISKKISQWDKKVNCFKLHCVISSTSKTTSSNQFFIFKTCWKWKFTFYINR